MQCNQYIIESCEHQNATRPIDFVSMTHAYHCAMAHRLVTSTVTEGLTLRLSKFATGYNKYRMVIVTFTDGSTGAPWREIPRLMAQLFEAQFDITPEEFYQRFEEIHPFEDGNGRVGSLLYNILNDTIQDPIHPPEFKK